MPRCGKFLLAVNGKNSKLLVCQDRECGYRETLSRTTNARCPNCHKKMEMIVKGVRRPLSAPPAVTKRSFPPSKKRREKEGAGVNKRDVARYLNQQKKEAEEPINNAFAAALSGLKHDK